MEIEFSPGSHPIYSALTLLTSSRRRSPLNNPINFILSLSSTRNIRHTTIGCGKQGFPFAQPYLSLLIYAASRGALNIKIGRENVLG
ncbi:hypothetical protein ACN42_g11163 [Penicillium freii]|uniref:Uncharacterized protein n=1 Tax=Penicillium freii TaxID=48697 RepID=A0A124GPU7_PENFR|nr:hypothetical protein ACN42_g11163 [Penicillium freii]